MGENSKLGMLLCSSWKRINLIRVCGWHKNWLERNTILIRCGKYSTKKSIWERTITEPCLNRQFPRWEWRNYHSLKIFVFLHGPMTWMVMQRSVWNDIVSWQTRRLSNSTKYLLHESMTTTSKRKKQNLLENCQVHALKIVLKCFYLAWIGRLDILWSVNKLARSITKWTKACDKRLNRLISYMHHICEYKQYCHVGNTAKQCRLWLFQDSDFAGDLEDSKSTSGGTLCVFGSHTFVPISWMCKKQSAVSHSYTESEIISLDTGLRLDGLLALELWDLIVSVLGSIYRVPDRSVKFERDNHKHYKSHNKIDVMKDIDAVPSNVQSAKLYCMCSRTMKLWSRW